MSDLPPVTTTTTETPVVETPAAPAPGAEMTVHTDASAPVTPKATTPVSEEKKKVTLEPPYIVLIVLGVVLLLAILYFAIFKRNKTPGDDLLSDTISTGGPAGNYSLSPPSVYQLSPMGKRGQLVI